MTIKEQFAALSSDLAKPRKDVAKAQLAAKIMQLMADLQEDATDVPTEAFEAIGVQGRKMAAMGLSMLVMTTLQEE